MAKTLYLLRVDVMQQPIQAQTQHSCHQGQTESRHFAEWAKDEAKEAESKMDE